MREKVGNEPIAFFPLVDEDNFTQDLVKNFKDSATNGD